MSEWVFKKKAIPPDQIQEHAIAKIEAVGISVQDFVNPNGKLEHEINRILETAVSCNHG
jgi:hypothetical protein